MSSYHNQAIAYRPEIDGLRAVAVLPVILFHAGFELFSGGYVGVDVFFVISGYLITSILLREMERGSFSIVRFYERRARRILPALFFVVACCLPFAWMWMLPDDLKRFGQSLVAVAMFSSNIYFWRKTDYFAPVAEEQPLLHTWSLAVEEQFYILFPLFLMVCWQFGKSKIFAWLALLAVLSLGLAELGWRHQPTANFYLLPTRAWELLAGSMLAFLPSAKVNQASNSKVAEIASMIGLALIVYSIFVFDASTPFPSIYTVIPVTGTVLIIAFGSLKSCVGKLLSRAPFVWVGLISYSAYLWHQPIFAFLRVRGVGHPSQLEFALGAVASLGLAYLTWKLIEQPTRTARISQASLLKASFLGLIAMLCFGLTVHVTQGFERRFALLDEAVTSTFSRANANCFDKQTNANKLGICSIASDEETSKADYLVLGDSHMYSMLPGFRKVEATNGHARKGAYVGFSGCPPLLGVHALRSDQKNKNCFDLNRKTLESAIELGVKEVYLVARWTYYTDGGYTGDDFSFIGTTPDARGNKESSREAFIYGLEKTLSEWREKGIVVRIVLQVPQQKYEPKEIYFKAAVEKDVAVLEALSVTNVEHNKLQEWVNSSFEIHVAAGRVDLIDPASVMCLELRCPVGTISASFYFDNDHLSINGAKRLSEILQHKSLEQ